MLRPHVLARAVDQIVRQSRNQPVDRRLLQMLRFGWGNESFSADLDYLERVAESAAQVEGAILECGSGVTTLLLGLLAGRHKQNIYVLEHEPEWFAIVRAALSTYHIEGVRLCLVPLRDYGDFTWYQPNLELSPETFSLVVCDGPPESTPGGRYGLVPVMRKYLNSQCTILVDDANTVRGSQILARWQAEWSASVTVIQSTAGDFAEVRIGHAC